MLLQMKRGANDNLLQNKLMHCLTYTYKTLIKLAMYYQNIFLLKLHFAAKKAAIAMAGFFTAL